MRSQNLPLCCFAVILAVRAITPPEAVCQTPTETIDYSKLAFFPDRWKEQNVSFEMLPWEGKHVVLLTAPGRYNPLAMKRFVTRLDAGWKTYEEMVGQSPKKFRHIDGKATICALPKPNLSCGYGCGYVGLSGIEVSAFYGSDLPAFVKDPRTFKHYYFYEMGRNYFVFGDRHSLFTTGYAVFMRYVCMDALKCKDEDLKTRRIIENCEELYAKSDLSFLDAFTNLGSGEKAHRLVDPSTGKKIVPSDQPVIYAAAMLKMRRHFGGDQWTKDFLHALHDCPEIKATDEASAIQQALNWFVCSSVAAKRDPTAVFVKRWRMPMTRKQLEIVSQTDWKKEDLDVGELVQLLTEAGP